MSHWRERAAQMLSPENVEKLVTAPDAPDAPPSLTEREAVLQVIDGAFDEITRICQERWDGKEGWRTSIPAQRGYDSDLILADALVAARNFIREAP